MESTERDRSLFYTAPSRPPRPPRTDKNQKKHLSLNVEMQQQHSLMMAENDNDHRDAMNIHFLSRTQQIVRERIHSSKDPSSIDLSKCHLTQIPRFIFLDTNIQDTLIELNLSHNKLASLPPLMSMLKNLVVLDCAFNEITDLPTELADLTELQHLNLAGNPLIASLKQPLLLGTAAVLQHIRERKRPTSGGSLRKRDRIKDLFAHSNSSQIPQLKAPPPKSPAAKTDQPDPQSNAPSHNAVGNEFENPLIAQMKLGLEASVGLTTTNPSANSKFKTALTDARGTQFEFNSYCNAQFSELRAMAGINIEQFRESLGSITALGFSGKSGSVLLRSADNLIVLKTISAEESSFLRRILTQYCDYMKCHPNTILTRFWGLYKVVRGPIIKVNFIVMKNAFSSGDKIHERYDLKGSRIGRHSGEENLRLSRVMLKDLDLCQMNRRIRLGPCRKQFLEQVTSDCKFLEKFEIIDYSLILGIHYLDDTTTEEGGEVPDGAQHREQSHVERLWGEIVGKDEHNESVGEMYFMTIIDMLQPYNLRKSLEYGFKSIRYGDDISVIPPAHYANRFISFITAVAD